MGPFERLLVADWPCFTIVLDARENLLWWSWSRHIGGSHGEGSDQGQQGSKETEGRQESVEDARLRLQGVARQGRPVDGASRKEVLIERRNSAALRVIASRRPRRRPARSHRDRERIGLARRAGLAAVQRVARSLTDVVEAEVRR